jgi:hypothetical protein
VGTRFVRDEKVWLRALRPGDIVQRLIGRPASPMRLKVTAVTETRIFCGDWEFDRDTGWEIDEELGWGPGGSGSRICPI